MDFTRNIEEVVETIQNARERKKGCSLLVGAGCSVKAGIPTARGLVEEISRRYPIKYSRAGCDSYPYCMAQLLVSERRDLIKEYVDKAKINWAHVGIAALIKAGYVDRVLTTNFDLLVVKACALLGEFPAIYDVAASSLYKAADIPAKAVIYLHGQYTGFVLMHTEEECTRHSQSLTPVFEDAGRGRMWLVVGYSGENDPVFEHLAGVEGFDNGLYWVGYKENPPARHLRDKLLLPGKDAYFVPGFEADDFFVKLTQELKIFPPDLVEKPFTHLDALLQMLAPYSLPGETERDVTHSTRQLIGSAIEQYEKLEKELPESTEVKTDKVPEIDSTTTAKTIQNGWVHLMQGDYDKVMALQPHIDQKSEPELLDLIAWGYILAANNLAKLAEKSAGSEADRLFSSAGEKYEQALQIKPDSHEALYNWGKASAAQAKTKQGEESNRLYALAGEKYEQALQIKPDSHEALNNWGNASAAQAKTKQGEESNRLYALAGEKYEQALQIKPDSHDALNNWGNALAAQAETKQGEESDRLYALASKKYEQALQIKPDSHDALNNWGNALAAQAETKQGEESDRLYALASKKYEQALQIKPDSHEALYNWGKASAAQAKTKQGEESDRLYALAGEKYEQALQIKPDSNEALNNWGSASAAQAKTKQGEESDRLYALAGEKYEQALQIKPDSHEALNNWGSALINQANAKIGELANHLYKSAQKKLLAAEDIKPGVGSYNLSCIAALSGNEEECRNWLEKSRDKGMIPKIEHLANDTDLDSVRNKPWFSAFLEMA